MIEFRIPGRPVAWQRAGLNTGKGRAIVYTKGESRSYQAIIREAAGKHSPGPGCFKMDIEVWCRRPKNHCNSKGQLKTSAPYQCIRKPDLDNVAKQIGDALNGILWHDDSQIVELRVRRFWGASDCVLVNISEIPL